jgi:mono/diheme cytochrome c family protein
MKTRILITLGALVTSIWLAACAGAPATPNNTPEPTASPTPAGDAAAGETAFMGTCVSCHGPDGKGIAGLGKDLTTSDFVAQHTDDELIQFISTGRPASDPLNTTGVDMPPKGGNPVLNETDLKNIIAYLRTLQEAAGR